MVGYQLGLELLFDLLSCMQYDVRDVPRETTRLLEEYRYRGKVKLGVGSLGDAMWLGAVQIHAPLTYPMKLKKKVFVDIFISPDFSFFFKNISHQPYGPLVKFTEG